MVMLYSENLENIIVASASAHLAFLAFTNNYLLKIFPPMLYIFNNIILTVVYKIRDGSFKVNTDQWLVGRYCGTMGKRRWVHKQRTLELQRIILLKNNNYLILV